VTRRELPHQLRGRAGRRQRDIGEGVEEAHAGGEELRQDDPLRPSGAGLVTQHAAATKVLADVAEGGLELDGGDPDGCLLTAPTITSESRLDLRARGASCCRKEPRPFRR